MKKRTFLTILFTFLYTVILYSAVLFVLIYFNFLNVDASFKINELSMIIEKNAIMPFNKEEAEHNALGAYVATLEDEYAYYLGPETYDEYVDEGKGNTTGIGIVISSDSTVEKGLFITRVIGNSPAEEAGVLAGDMIIQVEDTVLDGIPYYDAYTMLVGEVDSSVNITVSRDDRNLNFDVKRKYYTQRNVDFEIMDDDIGFIRIHHFDKNAYSGFENALNECLKAGVKSFIFDVRNNGGGDLDTVTDMVSLLTPKDILIIMKYKNEEEIIYTKGNRKTELPMVVLMNGSSASASELFASSLRDLNNSVLVGETSYGKGIGQTTYRITNGAGVRLTTFKYLTKSRTDYHEIGLLPDYEVVFSEDEALHMYTFDERTDAQLSKAIEILNEY